MVVKKKSKGTPTALSGAKGPGFKPRINKSPRSGGDFDDKFVWFSIPPGAENVLAVPLEDIYTWFVVHPVKSVTDRYFGQRFIRAPINEDAPEEPTYVDEWISKNPKKAANIIQPAKTIAATTLWVPEGVPSKDDPNEKYQVNGRKGIVLPYKGIKPVFDLEFKEAQKHGKDLRGLKFYASRSEGDKVPRCGDTWRCRNRMKLEYIEKKLGLKQSKWALDWGKIIPEVNEKQFKVLVKELLTGDSGGSASLHEDPEDDIPF